MTGDRLGLRRPGKHVGFDPIGIRIQPGDTVRWIQDSPGNPHTTTAYHPRNARHSLRIPPDARPWDSGFLVNPGDRFGGALLVGHGSRHRGQRRSRLPTTSA